LKHRTRNGQGNRGPKINEQIHNIQTYKTTKKVKCDDSAVCAQTQSEHIASVNRSVRAHYHKLQNKGGQSDNTHFEHRETYKMCVVRFCADLSISIFIQRFQNSDFENFGSNNFGGKSTKQRTSHIDTEMRKIINDNGQWYDEKCVSRKAKGHRGDKNYSNFKNDLTKKLPH